MYDDLENHEGYGIRHLPDGTTTSAWEPATAAFTAYIAACECGWRGGDHAPTEDGYEKAVDEWDERHARPLLATAIPPDIKQMIRELQQAVQRLFDERPRAGLKAARDLGAWAEAAATRGASRAELDLPTGAGRRTSRRGRSL
ncbi:MAG: hypothetical protein ACRDZW_00685 [Acidimicrobiales bacterium]